MAVAAEQWVMYRRKQLTWETCAASSNLGSCTEADVEKRRRLYLHWLSDAVMAGVYPVHDYVRFRRASIQHIGAVSAMVQCSTRRDGLSLSSRASNTSRRHRDYYETGVHWVENGSNDMSRVIWEDHATIWYGPKWRPGGVLE